jgi:hypothetical protein
MFSLKKIYVINTNLDDTIVLTPNEIKIQDFDPIDIPTIDTREVSHSSYIYVYPQRFSYLDLITRQCICSYISLIIIISLMVIGIYLIFTKNNNSYGIGMFGLGFFFLILLFIAYQISIQSTLRE